MEARHLAPSFPSRRLVLPPLFLLVFPTAVLGLIIRAGAPINIHFLSGALVSIFLIACFIALAYLEVTGCTRAAVLLNGWPSLRTTRNWLALAIGILSLLAAVGMAAAFFA